jgi:lipoate-protein ligase A
MEKPVLRFYSWTEPAASFGYFQKYEDVARLTHLRPLVRRPTAGGLVPHDADWTYSLVLPNSHPWYSLRAAESYRRVHEWLQAAFARVDVSTDLASCRRESGHGQCFAGYEKSDLLWQGRKIAGAAQRRTREGLLIQGSVQPPPLSLSRNDWEHAACSVPGLQEAITWQNFEPDTGIRAGVESLVGQKYSQQTYNRKR